MKKENIFQKSSVFRFIILLMLISNIAYVSIEIYKSQFSKSFVNKSDITEVAFSQLITLSNYALVFESVFLLLSILGVVMMFIKMYRPLLASYLVIQLLFLTSVLMLNTTLAWTFGAPVGNMTQLLYAPFVLAVVTLIYFLIKNTFLKKESMDYKVSQ
jgi:magnesium-transporting ATPase (P-type)